jgi:L-lactate dehydrogenase complex protein LldF
MNCGLNPWAEGHEMMKFPKKPFHQVVKELQASPSPSQGGDV